VIFLMLYKELYYRHIYSNLLPTLSDRIHSFQNYCDLFDTILNAKVPLNLALPEQWLWDMLDEFVYQLQSFCQYKTKPPKNEDEVATLNNHPNVWKVVTVLQYMDRFIERSDITAQLLQDPELHNVKPVNGNPFSAEPLYLMLGYFSLISQSRVHCLLGDYWYALKILDPIDLSQKNGPHTRVTHCYVSLFYYVGFSYMMMRRYLDAIRTFYTIILYISRNESHTRSYQYDQISKKKEQMCGLLVITVSLCPQRIDDNLQQILENWSEKFLRMQRADDSAYEESFHFSCPKFITPCPGQDNFGGVMGQLNLQRKLFMNQVHQHVVLHPIRSYLKLYTSIRVSKIASFLDMSEEALKTNLLLYKHKAFQIRWHNQSPLSGKLELASDVDFYLDNDMIHISDTKVSEHYAEYFLKAIRRLDDLMTSIERPSRPAGNQYRGGNHYQDNYHQRNSGGGGGGGGHRNNYRQNYKRW